MNVIPGHAMSLVIDIDINPVLVHVGPIAIHWYGLMYVVGIMVGLRLAFPYLNGFGIDQERSYQIFWPTLVACLVGGRLYYVVQSNLGWYLRHPARILATWEGGMAFYGAVFFGVPMVYFLSRRHHLPFLRLLDGAALISAATQTFGRVGNVINGDIVGYPSSLPWATRYVNPANTFVSSHVVAYEPAAVYELFFSAALLFLLWRIRGRDLRPGVLFLRWLTVYSVGQFVLFAFRANPIIFLGLKQAQLTSLAVLLLVVPLALWYRRRKPVATARVAT